MKTLYIILFCFSFTFSQAQSYQWANNEGGGGEDRAFGVAADKWSNVYATGLFRGAATFGTTVLNSSGVEDIFLVKYDSTGNVMWAKQFGGPNVDIGYDVVTDVSGNCYVSGTFYNTATFGAYVLQSGTTSDYDAFILKADSSGNVLWVKKAGGVDYDQSRGIAISGNQLYMTGVFTGPATFDSITVNGSGLQDVFLASYNLNGNIKWVTVGGGTNYDVGYGVSADANGNAYVTGYFSGQGDFGGVTIINGSLLYVDMFVFKSDSSGNVQWAKRGGATGDDDAGRAISADSSGNVYVAGEVRGTGQFDSFSYTNAGIAEAYVAKYDTSGNIQFLTTYGGQGGDYAYGIASDNNNVYVTGLFNSTAQFGTASLTSAGSNDIYLATINAVTGNITGAIRAGGLGDDAGRAVAIDLSGSVLHGGDFERNNSTFAPFTLNTNGSHDVFVARTGGNSTVGINSINASDEILVYPNPVINDLQIQFKTDLSRNIQFELYSVNSQLIRKIDMSGSSTVSLRELPASIYFYRFVSGGVVIAKGKLIKD